MPTPCISPPLWTLYQSSSTLYFSLSSSCFDKEISGYLDQQTGEWHSGKWYALYAPLDAMGIVNVRGGISPGVGMVAPG